MLEFLSPRPHSFCDRMTRRELLRLGGLAPLGLSLPALLGAGRASAGAEAPAGFGKAKRCLMIFLWGGPAHQDTFDLKPDAPAEIRGEFKPVRTRVPGLEICEHFPQLAKHTDKIALIRSVTHSDRNHSTAAHWMLTGHKHRLSAENFGPSPADSPHIGSVVAKVAPAPPGLPTFVALPERIATTIGAVVPGQGGGALGGRYDPFRIDQHPDAADFSVRQFTLPADVPAARFAARRDLRAAFDAARRLLDRTGAGRRMGEHYRQALDMVTSPRARRAFDLNAESDRVRDRYGRGTFGQGLLLARRLLEAGVKLVTVYWHRDRPGVDTTWDTHAKNFEQLKNRLIPQVDGPVAALLEDLGLRGMLGDTLVLWTSEFGRTPKVNRNAGRDHWGACNSVWLAGAGVAAGTVFGSSDKSAAYPASDPVGPEDLAATVFHLLGIPPETIVRDLQERPLAVSHGRVIAGVLA
ncbi:MAG TPA: DUF1501 domain-containing protein [Gemmataceae bacterium]